MREGAEAAADEAGYDIVVTDAQDDASTQLSDIEDLLQQNVDVLLVNPVDSEAVATAIESANEQDVPVITVDRSAAGGEVATHIASDNVSGGEMAGEFIAEQLEESGNWLSSRVYPVHLRQEKEGKASIISWIPLMVWKLLPNRQQTLTVLKD